MCVLCPVKTTENVLKVDILCYVFGPFQMIKILIFSLSTVPRVVFSSVPSRTSHGKLAVVSRPVGGQGGREGDGKQHFSCFSAWLCHIFSGC